MSHPKLLRGSIIAVSLLAIGAINISCGKNNDPTTPTLPNSFQIVSIDNYGITDWGCFGVTIYFANNTDAGGTLTGKFYFGDGTSQDITEITSAPGGWPLNAKTTTSTEVGRFNHDYAALGTYRVKAEFTANFKNESITRTMEKDFILTRD